MQCAPMAIAASSSSSPTFLHPFSSLASYCSLSGYRPSSSSLHPRLLHRIGPSSPLHLRCLRRIGPSSLLDFQRFHQQFNPFRALNCFVCEELSSVFDYLNYPNDAVAVGKFQGRKIVVLGGSGFVGSAVCKAAVGHGFDVVSLSRSGRPTCRDAWVDKTVWIAGDVFYADWDSIFHGATAVISAIGVLGINEKFKGEADLLAINAALNAGIQKFILISIHDYDVPGILKNTGYFDGKRKAEAEVLAKFANTGTVLRPGFIYGRKTLNGLQVPLDMVGGVWDWVHDGTKVLTRPFTVLPASDLVLAPPVSVNDVATAAIKAVVDDDVFGIYTIEQIKDLASSMKLESQREDTIFVSTLSSWLPVIDIF